MLDGRSGLFPKEFVVPTAGPQTLRQIKVAHDIHLCVCVCLSVFLCVYFPPSGLIWSLCDPFLVIVDAVWIVPFMCHCIWWNTIVSFYIVIFLYIFLLFVNFENINQDHPCFRKSTLNILCDHNFVSIYYIPCEINVYSIRLFL